jgi:UDP-N-acetylglucosamine 2-epimerase (non-hydrolysing)/GDP/UDP-N,N'-diacetylbacillosamine 2-epimerase (hydrolysing)
MARKVAVLTGSRSDYGILFSVLRAIDVHPELRLRLVVTGSHLSEAHGMTVREIESDRWEIAARVHILQEGAGDGDLDVARTTGQAVSGIAEAFSLIEPDITLFLGDRYETFAGALAAATLRLPIAHIGGGECDQATCLDGYLRNALTQLAHLHFVSCDAYAERLAALGQDPWRIHVVGIPSLDGLTDGLLTLQQMEAALGIPIRRPLILGTYLPVTLRPEQSRAELKALLAALGARPEATVILTLSNIDAGARWMDKAVRSFAEDRPGVHVYASLGRRRYRSLMALADAVIGNSSSGVIETPTFGVPTINIGARQEGRLRPDNIIDVPGQADAIADALDRALHDRDFRARAAAAVNPFGDGHAGERIAAILSELTIDRELLEKRVPSGGCCSEPAVVAS